MAAGVLVVDDDHALLRLLQAVLTRKGIPSDAASNPRDAIQRATSHPYQVVVSDWHFPESGGAEFLEHLRVLPDRPLVILTVGAEIETSTEIAEVVSLVVKKPYDPLALSEVIANCVTALGIAPIALKSDTASN